MPLLVSEPPLPLIAMPSFCPPVVVITPVAVFTSVLLLFAPSKAAPRPVGVVPVNVTVPALVIVLDVSTVRAAVLATVRVNEMVLPLLTFTLTLVLPLAAITVVSVPVQVTVVPLVGAVLSHAALARPGTQRETAKINGRKRCGQRRRGTE